MENASKALLIAGAILIVIVLISIGMAIVNSSKDVIDEVGHSTADNAVTVFNSTFSSYEGTQKGASVRSLLQAISTSNATNKNTSGRLISVTVGSLTAETDSSKITGESSNIVTSAKYKVVMSGIDSDGYINAITITRQ